ncbi:hypothetical protein ACN47E_005254 [Coniothyrium glycines]
MFSWITGPRITNAIEDLQPENNYETTFIEPPETPAHQFAVKAFKHAIFGTPAPVDATKTSKRAVTKAQSDAAISKPISLPAPKEEDPPVSPSKLPGGILMTPGTMGKGRKTVSFGSQVLDNEGKRGNTGRSGVPNDCPGKFPSPWTPGTQLKVEPVSDLRPRTKLTEALLDARTTTQPKPGQKVKARDDSDITMDLGAPRSESGKYWKEQYENYAERSEKEMKKVIAKQQLAKKYAMKKDGEVTELVTKLEQERKQYRQREKDLEQQNKDFQERLRQAMAENMSSSTEIVALKARIATLEHSINMPSSDLPSVTPSFQIYEDTGKEATQHQTMREKKADTSFAPSLSMASSGKENTPTPRASRRQSAPHSAGRPTFVHTTATTEEDEPVALGKSPRRAEKPSNVRHMQPTKPVSSTRKLDTHKTAAVPSSPVHVLPSSPLPMPTPDPSPDPWLEVDASSIHRMDKMALPVSTGDPYTRPEWNPPPKQHRAAKAPSHSRPDQHHRKSVPVQKAVESKGTVTQESAQLREREVSASVRKALSKETTRAGPAATMETNAQTSPLDPKFDLSKITAHHAQGSAQVQCDKVDMLPVDRKEQARRRLEERKRLRKNAPAS